MIKKGKQPITGTNTAMRPKPPVKTTADTSAGAERQILQPPAPFANKRGPVNLPVTKQFESRGTDTTGSTAASKGISIGGARALPPGGPVGQNKPINQSGQVFGRLGTSHPRKVGSQNLGKAKKGHPFYGE